jgi:hypothetical protein
MTWECNSSLPSMQHDTWAQHARCYVSLPKLLAISGTTRQPRHCSYVHYHVGLWHSRWGAHVGVASARTACTGMSASCSAKQRAPAVLTEMHSMCTDRACHAVTHMHQAWQLLALYTAQQLLQSARHPMSTGATCMHSASPAQPSLQRWYK